MSSFARDRVAQRQKNLPQQVFLFSEHCARRYVFERLAIGFEHMLQDFTQFHYSLRQIVRQVLSLNGRHNMTPVTKINPSAIEITFQKSKMA
jgi:hypothetical protein